MAVNKFDDEKKDRDVASAFIVGWVFGWTIAWCCAAVVVWWLT